MKTALQSKTVYEPNKQVKVTVVNKPVFADDGTKLGFDSKLTITTNMRRLDEVSFSSDDEIADFVGAIDFTDPQQQLEV